MGHGPQALELVEKSELRRARRIRPAVESKCGFHSSPYRYQKKSCQRRSHERQHRFGGINLRGLHIVPLCFPAIRVRRVRRWFAKAHTSTKAMAAMGQPLLGDGVFRASSGSRLRKAHARRPATSENNAAVTRAGTQLSTSSARAAQLPAQAQLRPL